MEQLYDAAHGDLREYLSPLALDELFERFSARHVSGAALGRPDGDLIDGLVPSAHFAVSGQGATLRTLTGEIVDFQSMTFNCILGQNDPWVKLTQIGYLLSGRPSFHSTRIASDVYYSLPARLRGLGIGGIADPVIGHRQCNGSDAVELAIAAAYAQRGARSTIISFGGSYHGQNWTAYAVSDLQRHNRFLLSAAAEVVFIEPPPSRTSTDEDPPLSAAESAVLEQVDHLAAQAYALVHEPIQMNNAVHVFSKAFLRGLEAICRSHAVAMIFDEVQTGLGWLGAMTASEYYGVVPDILALSKALTAGNGPLAVIVADRRYRALDSTVAAKTNGADLRSLVAAHAVLDRMLGIDESEIPSFVQGGLREELRGGLLAQVPARALVLERCLDELRQASGGVIGEVRGGGFIRGLIVLDPQGRPDAELAHRIADRCVETGCFLRANKHALVVKPPITITAAELTRGCEIVLEAIRWAR